MKSILILGAGAMQGPAMRIAREKGYRIIAADGNSRAVYTGCADQFLHIDLKDKEALARAAASIPGLVGVFTAGTDFSASVAWVAQELGLPGIPHEAALDASDKARMRARLAASGVPVPAYAYGTAADDPIVLANSVAPLPLVVKPVDNMGARGCRLARSEAELRVAWKDAVGHSRTGRAIVEEYLDGPEFSLDAVVYEGSVVLRGVADRIVVFEPFFVEMGHTMPTGFSQEIVDEVVKVFKDGIKALGIRDGAAKGDIKYTSKGAFVGEIAARLSGGYMSGWTYPYSSGVEATAEAIDIACGVEPVMASPTKNLVCSERAWISIPGTVATVHGLDDAKNMDGVRDLFQRAAEGDRVVFPANNVEKCGNIIAVAPDRIEADKIAESAARAVLLRLESGDESTKAFLRNEDRIVGPDGSVWPPEAFTDWSAMTLASLATLPDTVKNQSPFRTVSIAPLRGIEGENSRDWQGRSIQDSLGIVKLLTGAGVDNNGDVVLGASFWRAFKRGGYQAGVWVVDTAMRHGLDALP